MIAMPYILADDSDPSIKIIFGAIVVVIWIIGGIMNSMKKKGGRATQEYTTQQDWSHLLRDLTAGQAKPWTPSTPAPPPPLPPAPPQQQVIHRQRMQQVQQVQQRQQVKSFAQQSPRPLVQQYPRRPLPAKRQVMPPKQPRAFQGPKPIVKKQKTQRRQPPALPQTASSSPHMAPHAPVPENAILTSSAPGGSAGVHTSSSLAGRTAAARITSQQLRKLIVWSEILAPPLSLRDQ